MEVSSIKKSVPLSLARKRYLPKRRIRLPKTNPSLFTDFMESGKGIVQPHDQSDTTAQPINDVRNSTQGPADGSNDHTNTTASGDGDDSEDEDEEGGDINEKVIVTCLNTLHDMIIAKHDAPRAGRIPGLKYGNTLFEHQKHAVGATMLSLAGPSRAFAYRCTSLILLESKPWKPVGKYTILYEAPTIKNRNTRTFVAVTALRGQSEGCLTLTGTPLDNTWEDGNALPKTIHRTWGNGPLTSHRETHDPIHPDARRSQLLQSDFHTSRSPSAQDWHCATLRSRLGRQSKKGDIGDAISEDADAQALAHAAEWCQHLEQGDNSLSRRVQAILNIVRQHLDFRPDGSFIIVDESVWFLDIVAIALEKTYHPVGHDTYNGRLDTVQRHSTINKIAQVTPLHTLLTSRGTGG
ncbi:global transactivator [Fusarium mexicanum]|uniref:Global transactivator n=1 Tax=Fusarium mexicanum TaxID=751941 RepID=A0A8H5MJP3_9HYPO|nr:global transactivator [Fusarium mexicanum]